MFLLHLAAGNIKAVFLRNKLIPLGSASAKQGWKHVPCSVFGIFHTPHLLLSFDVPGAFPIFCAHHARGQAPPPTLLRALFKWELTGFISCFFLFSNEMICNCKDKMSFLGHCHTKNLLMCFSHSHFFVGDIPPTISQSQEEYKKKYNKKDRVSFWYPK